MTNTNNVILYVLNIKKKEKKKKRGKILGIGK
jgi:hypothetical protein